MSGIVIPVEANTKSARADLEALNTVGLPVAVANAQPAIKKVAKYVTKKAGGSGAIREISDLILHP